MSWIKRLLGIKEKEAPKYDIEVNKITLVEDPSYSDRGEGYVRSYHPCKTVRCTGCEGRKFVKAIGGRKRCEQCKGLGYVDSNNGV